MVERLRPSGLRARLSIAIAAILVAAVGATFLVIYRGTGSTLRAGVDTELREEGQAFAHGLRGAKDPDALAAAGRRYVRTPRFGPSARLLVLALSDGRIATNDPELLGLQRDLDRESSQVQRREDEQIRGLLATPPGFSTVRLEDTGAVRVITRPVEGAGVLRVGEPLASVARAQEGVARAFFVAGSLTLVAALAAGYVVAARTTDPLRRMARTAARIDAGELSHRIGPTGPSEEIRTLAESFDHMLDRLDDAFARQREFVADASHELRTPLTVIRGQLEVLARSGDPSAEDVRRVESLVATEVARMQRLVDDLLLLASAEEGAPPRLKPVDVRRFLTEQLGGIEATVDRRFALGTVADGTVLADPDGLAQAIRNLIRNAVEHTAVGGSVSLSAVARGDRIEFAVEDDGPGIPFAQRERVFQRLYRAPPSGAGGSGLGLAIARAIIEAHAGRIWADEAGTGGARVAFELPRFAAARA
ncbi:MAG: two-component system, OmpR family, sensor kinase [Thermoleophilaceae bacterium]|nr:two-component system, OmpR family, sensor kinase [Thermoleophilaceae bacterium]